MATLARGPMCNPELFTHDLFSMRDLAITVAEDAGALLLDGLGRARATVETKTSPTDVVTEMDRASERLIAERIAIARPQDGLLGEEGANTKSASGVTWIVDPLDGTVNYLYGMAPFAVSLAAEVDGEVKVGVVHDPVHGETFSAIKGHGAWLGGQLLVIRPLSGQTGEAPRLATSLVATGFSYSLPRRNAQATAVAKLLGEVRDIRRCGAAAIDLCWVAAGRVDAYYESGIQKWDVAGGGLVASEAGGSVFELPGRDGCLPVVVAARPGLEAELRELLIRSGADAIPAG